MSKCHRGFLVFATIVIAFFACSCASQGRLNLKEPAVPDDIRVFDFGRVKGGVRLEHSFFLKNHKDKPLAITGIHTSCGCTVSETRKKYLGPQEFTLIDVKFNTQGYSGAVQQYVYVHTDDAGEPIVKFSVKAEVTE